MYRVINIVVSFLKRIVPEPLVRPLRPLYHRVLAFMSALLYGFPARYMTVIGVTGTKGKSTVVELIGAALEEAGYTVALTGSIRTKIKDVSRPKDHKMTVPGRGFLQSFLSESRKAGCTHAVIELTSEGALQYRHWFLSLNALVLTNIAPEHIEAHGSFENYAEAKLHIGRSLARSFKRPRAIVVNSESPFAERFLALPVENKLPFSLSRASDVTYKEEGASFNFEGTRFSLALPGEMSVMNALAALLAARHVGASLSAIARGFKSVVRIPGRVDRIEAGQNFLAIVDYAHTPDSLKALYEAFPARRKICMVSAAGGGRDAWKRPEMGKIAEIYCAEVILTSEDPYDESPERITRMIAEGMTKKSTVIIDRREAIRESLRRAKPGDAVFFTSMGSDPYLMGPSGEKIPWNEPEIVREELKRLVS